MLTRKDLEQKLWWSYIEEDLQELLIAAFLLLEHSKAWSIKFHDYSFVVFPAAKAYEGFLKKLFLDMKFISEDDYFGKHFRIGKSLNPNLDVKYRNEDWVYDDLEKFCKGKALPDKLWETWRKARNLVFHWFPNELNAISISEAEDGLLLVVDAIDSVFDTCNVELSK